MVGQEQGKGKQANQNYIEIEHKGKEQKVATHDQSKIAHLASLFEETLNNQTTILRRQIESQGQQQEGKGK